VRIDGQDTGQLAPFTQGARGLRSTVQNLRDLGLDPTLFGVAGQDSFDLDGVAGLTYTYDAARQKIDLRLGDALRHPVELGARTTRPTVPADAGRGLLLNYNLHAEANGSRTVSSITELRYFSGAGVLATTGAAVFNGDARGYVRYDTTWTRSDPADLSSLEIGDLIVPPLGWTRGVRLGGIQWRRNFALRPDLLTYPVATYGASAVVPSSVSLYVDGVRQFQANVSGGPYQVRDIGGLNGAGQATIVTEDALGRINSTTLPLYVDTRLLEAGLTDYAVSLGAPRRAYGVESFRYAATPVLEGSVRHGWSGALTLEGHAEATRGLVDVGAGLLVRLGQAGVVSAALAASKGQGGGTGAGSGRSGGGYANLGYQYITRGWSIDALSERTTAGFADVGTVEGSPYVRASDRANFSLALSQGQSVGLGFINYKVPLQPAARIVSLSLARQLGWGLHLSVSAYRDLRRDTARGVQATLSMAFGGRTAGSATFGTQNGVAGRTLAASSAPDVGGGIGWSAQKGEFGGQSYDQVQVQYLGNAGQVGLLTQSAGGLRTASVDLSGSLVAMDGTVLAARHVGRGFALVSTGQPGLPVLQENRAIGTTDSNGRLLVPDLMPYTRNEIIVDTTSLPADMRVTSARQTVVPRQSAGVVARFGFERYAAATVIVHGADGKPLPVGTVAHLEGGKDAVVGYDGVVFVEDLKPDNVLTVGEGAAQCRLHFAYVPAAGGALPTVGPLACTPHP
jgi:outer membrane usher protein